MCFVVCLLALMAAAVLEKKRGATATEAPRLRGGAAARSGPTRRAPASDSFVASQTTMSSTTTAAPQNDRLTTQSAKAADIRASNILAAKGG